MERRAGGEGVWDRPTPRWGGGRRRGSGDPRAEEREQMHRLRFKPEQGLNLSDLPHRAAAGAQTASPGSRGPGKARFGRTAAGEGLGAGSTGRLDKLRA